MNGTLVKATTDPKVSLVYNFGGNNTTVITKWYFWISAFQYKWGFYYRYWRLFKGWTGDKIIAQWSTNGPVGKWAIIDKSWIIYF